MKLEYIVDQDEMMLKDFIILKGISKSLARKIKLYGRMYINGEESKNYFLVKKGDKVTLEYNEVLNSDILVNNEELDIRYEDDHILIVNKRKNLATQPSRLHQFDNLISLVKSYFIKQGINTNIHLVNRLDYSTSGLVIIAKDGYTHNELSKIDITKKYYALVSGHLDKTSDTINLKIGRVVEHNIKRWVMENGKESITKYNVIKEYDDYSLVDIELLTGRTHQIRVSFAYLLHPLLGDKLYGEGEDLKLCCYYIKFINPFDNKTIEISIKPNWVE